MTKKHQLVASGTCPDWESNARPSSYWMTHQQTETPWPGQNVYLLTFKKCNFLQTLFLPLGMDCRLYCFNAMYLNLLPI